MKQKAGLKLPSITSIVLLKKFDSLISAGETPADSRIVMLRNEASASYEIDPSTTLRMTGV